MWFDDGNGGLALMSLHTRRTNVPLMLMNGDTYP
jgi:hypothetical protein